MCPPAFASISSGILSRFDALLAAEGAAEVFPELLAAQESITCFVRELGLTLLQRYVDVCAKQALANRAPCNCGQLREVLKRQSWAHNTLLGSIMVPDPYTYCRVCHDKERPAQALLGTDGETWSLPTQEAAVDLAADEPCGKAVAKLARHHPGVEMGRTTALRLLHQHGVLARVFIDGKLAAARAEAQFGVPPQHPAVELEAEFDASMIPVATLEAVEPPEGEEPKRTPEDRRNKRHLESTV